VRVPDTPVGYVRVNFIGAAQPVGVLGPFRGGLLAPLLGSQLQFLRLGGLAVGLSTSLTGQGILLGCLGLVLANR